VFNGKKKEKEGPLHRRAEGPKEVVATSVAKKETHLRTLFSLRQKREKIRERILRSQQQQLMRGGVSMYRRWGESGKTSQC